MTRIERAARAISKIMTGTESHWRSDFFRAATQQVLAAAYPELHIDPPTAWLAPWEATEAIRRGYYGASKRAALKDFSVVAPDYDSLTEDQVARLTEFWASSRDAHLADSQG